MWVVMLRKQRKDVISYHIRNNIEHLVHYLHVNQEGGIEDLVTQAAKFMPLMKILH
jgi:hypothetical protein